MRLSPLVLAACALAQDIKVTTRLVQVNVIVHNRKGQPVPDMLKSDFVLLDRGKQQTIGVFKADSSSQVVPRFSLPPNVFTNRLTSRRETAISATVILFDALNTKAKEPLLRSLQEVEFQDRIALYVLGRDLTVLHDFTDDPGHLLNLLTSFRGTGKPSLPDLDNVDRAGTTLRAMEAIANHLAGIPGRKNLVWVSGGFPFTRGPAQSAINYANVAIYPVDPTGMAPENAAAMQALADDTGGRAFFHVNAVREAISKAVDDASCTYTLGFYPSEVDWDGTYHKLQVKLPHQKGLDIRARKGFMAFSEQTPAAAEEQAAAQNTMDSPLDATGISLFVQSDPSDKPERGKLRLQIQIDPANITLQSRDGRWIGSLEFIFRQQSAAGKELVSARETVKLNLQPETYQQVAKNALLLTTYVVPVKDAVMQRLVVLDRPTGNMGSVHVPILAVPQPHVESK